MNNKTIKLIEILSEIELTKNPNSKPRDRHYEIVSSYNYGSPHYYVAHDGYMWVIEQYLPPSQNNFESFEKAERALQRVLLTRIKEMFVWSKAFDEWDNDAIAQFKERLELLSED